MLKYAHAQIMTKALAPTDASARELRRFAHRHHFDYQVRPGYLYVRSRAISSRCNDNFDEFPAEELEKSYASFKGKPVFVNHHNDDHKRARGVIIDAALHKDANRDGTKDYWVEVLMEVDALRFPKLAAEIMNGNIARTSMGCDVAFSVCSACGNKATTPAEYCQHIPASKGMTLYRTTASGHKVGEIIRETCYGLKFFENSLLVEPPADPTAFFLGVDDRGLKMAARRFSPSEGQGELFESGPYHQPKEPSVKSSRDGWTEGEAQDWDSIGERHPDVYGDREIHEGATGDGQGIGWAASHLAHATPEDPEDEEHGAYDLMFHSEHVDPYTIDHARHGAGDGRVQHAAEGYQKNPEQVPPLVLVHRHGVYQVADGHHRAEGAKLANQKTVRAYVAYSPFPDTPSGDGDKAPYHGAKKTPGKQPQWEKEHQAKYAKRVTLAELMAEGAAATPPEDHPWFKETGISHHHIVDHWDQATDEEKAQGKRWYPDAHLVAKSIAKLDPRIKSDAEAAHKGAGVLSAYSPQQGWWANQHNAARSFHEQRALGKGEGIMIMSSHANAAQKIMDGMPHHEALKGPKTQDFAHLIEHGGYKPQSEEDAAAGKPKEHSDKVVVDRHALSVAAGRRLNADDVKGFPSQSRKHYEVVAGHYRKAAAVISDREGREVPPHEVQAVTWLARQRLNAEGDTSPGQKGRNTVQKNQREKWQGLTREHVPELHEPPANSHVAGADVGGYRIQHASPGPESGVPYHQVSGQHGPEDLVDVFRAVPTHADRINKGDWVTLRGDWAQDRADSAPGHHVIQARVPAKHVFVDAKERDIDEAGYHGPHMTGPSVRVRNGAAPDQPRLFEGRRKTAYGEQKAPADVDTLREDACPVCGDRDTFDGAKCQVCGYVAPPKMFQDPDLEKARQMDLRKDIADFQDPTNPMAQGQVGPDGQPIDPQEQAGGPMDAGDLDENGNPINPDAADPGAQPGSLPGEVQAEVQPGGDPMDPQMLGPDGMPIDPTGIPNELGAPVDPAMLGPDGQPLQQPGQQMMVGPNGEPIGPQALPPGATTNDGKPFTPGPNMPMGPGEPEQPEGPEAPLDPSEMDQDGQIPNPDAGQAVPGTPGDGVPDLQCPACGFTADATNPVSVDMDTSIMPPDGQATPDGVQAGDVCPNCGAGQLMSPAEMQGQTPVPVPM